MSATERHPDDLRADETELLGQWLDTGARITGDAVEDRIVWLVAERLEHVASAEGAALYRDPRDGRLWELTRPYAVPGSGGPRRLVALPPDAAARYGLTEP